MTKKDLKRASIPYRLDTAEGPKFLAFHALRHSYLTMLGKTADLRTVQELAGYSRPEITARHAHKRHDDLAGAVGKVPSLAPAANPGVAHDIAQAVCNRVRPASLTCTSNGMERRDSAPPEVPESVGFFADLRRLTSSCTSEGDGPRTRNHRIDSPPATRLKWLKFRPISPVLFSVCRQFAETNTHHPLPPPRTC